MKWTWAIADVRGDFVPGDPGYHSGATPDGYFRAEAPRSLTAPKGSTTYNPVDGTLVVNCHQNLIDHDDIPRAVRTFREESGAKAEAIEIWVSAAAMVEEGLWLTATGFERQPDDNTGLFRWRQILTEAALQRWRDMERALEEEEKAKKLKY